MGHDAPAKTRNELEGQQPVELSYVVPVSLEKTAHHTLDVGRRDNDL
jgi:hypothetical protein